MYSGSYLNLDKEKYRIDVIRRLRTLGYNVRENACSREIRVFVRDIQKKNGLLADGFIGIKTMPLLGYSGEEIGMMLEFPVDTSVSSYRYPLWSLCC